jgi:hypothetical protein
MEEARIAVPRSVCAVVLACIALASAWGCGSGTNARAAADGAAQVGDGDVFGQRRDGTADVTAAEDSGASLSDAGASRDARLGPDNDAAFIVVNPLATTLDTVTFGDSASETQHHLTEDFGPVVAVTAPIPSATPAGSPSDVVKGLLGATARRLLPRTPNGDYYGGEMSFDMVVDPVRQNYFTIKLAGSDAASSWLVLDVDGLEIGERHGYLLNDEEMLLNTGGWYAGRFIYRTIRIPWQLTHTKTSVTIKLRSLGSIFYYGGPAYDNYQHRMTNPTPGVYRAYTHIAPELDVSMEPQGTAPTAGQAAPATTATWIAAWKTRVNGQLTTKLAAASSTVTADDLDFIAQAYGASWTVAYDNPTAVAQVLAAADAMVTAYAAAPTTYFAGTFADHGGNGGWGGYFGQVGNAIRILWPQLKGSMNATVNYGGSLGMTTRRAAWAAALRASVDFGRFHRKTISNQDMDCTRRIYTANAGLLLVDPTQGLNEAEARRYVYEGYGARPYLGNDQPGGGPVPVRGTAPFGPNWYMTTAAGTTKEDGLVGGDYGEQATAGFAFAKVRMGGDALLEAQTLKMMRARAALRYPATDSQGNAALVVPDAVGCRNDQEIGAHIAYLGNGTVDDVFVASQGAAAVGNDLVGYLQQEIADGQLAPRLSSWLAGYAGWNGVVYLPDDDAAFEVQPQTGVLLPMTSGQPDFAWADDENMVVAAKHGEERFWTVLEWRGANAINRLAKVFVTTPDNARLAEVTVDDVQYQPTGGTVTRTGAVEGFPAFSPPDHPVNANQGLVLPLALRADLTAPPPTNRDSGRGTAYTLRYGHWLVAINAYPTAAYTVVTPPGFSSAVDLISGRNMAVPVKLAPLSAAAFYLSTDALSTIAPATAVLVHGTAAAGSVTMSWDAVPGAATYRVQRAPAGVRPFVPIAPSVATLAYTDTGVTAGTAYEYVVAGIAADGTAGTASPPIISKP